MSRLKSIDTTFQSLSSCCNLTSFFFAPAADVLAIRLKGSEVTRTIIDDTKKKLDKSFKEAFEFAFGGEPPLDAVSLLFILQPNIVQPLYLGWVRFGRSSQRLGFRVVG
eukprot:1186858-Prorocentrum_minimum.AAC.2